MKKLTIIAIVIGLVFLAWHFLGPKKYAPVVDFASCLAAGRPIIETYPEQCLGADGKNYTQTVDELDLNTDPVVFSPDLSKPVTSPLVLSGEARGFWFFEKQFTVRLLDDKGKEIATSSARTRGEKMTVDFMPWNSTLTFKTPLAQNGELVFEKANPSGLASQTRTLRLPIIFHPINVGDAKTNKGAETSASSTNSSTTKQR
jgi:hypothetical protein